MSMKAKLSSELASRFSLYVFRKKVEDEKEEDGEKGGRTRREGKFSVFKMYLNPKTSRKQ